MDYSHQRDLFQGAGGNQNSIPHPDDSRASAFASRKERALLLLLRPGISAVSQIPTFEARFDAPETTKNAVVWFRFAE